MKRTIDFRRGGTQTVDLPGSGESHVTYEGKCPVTGTRLYSCDTGNDPRGPLGWHAVTEFVASEYDKTGPTMVASWLACNNDRSIYAKALAIAQRAWCDFITEVTQKDEHSGCEVEIDGVAVGVGTREECEALADELQTKPEVAQELKEHFAA